MAAVRDALEELGVFRDAIVDCLKGLVRRQLGESKAEGMERGSQYVCEKGCGYTGTWAECEAHELTCETQSRIDSGNLMQRLHDAEEKQRTKSEQRERVAASGVAMPGLAKGEK